MFNITITATNEKDLAKQIKALSPYKLTEIIVHAEMDVSAEKQAQDAFGKGSSDVEPAKESKPGEKPKAKKEDPKKEEPKKEEPSKPELTIVDARAALKEAVEKDSETTKGILKQFAPKFSEIKPEDYEAFIEALKAV